MQLPVLIAREHRDFGALSFQNPNTADRTPVPMTAQLTLLQAQPHYNWIQ